MHIVHVIPGLTRERGGTTAIVEALVLEQARRQTITLLTTDQGARSGESYVDLPGVRVERTAVVGPDRLAYSPRFADVARSIIAQADIVHIHSIFTYPVHTALTVSRRLGRPVVLSPQGMLHPYSLRRTPRLKAGYLNVWGPTVRRAVTAWHYTSQAEGAASWPHDDSLRFFVPNGIDPSQFAVDRRAASETVARLWPELSDTPYALFLGRLNRKKNLAFLVEQFLRSAPPEVRLVVAGPDEDGLWPPLAAKLGAASGQVIRLPLVTGTAKSALLAGARLFALSSEHENFGIAAAEALAAGTPVLLSPHVDMVETTALSRWVHVAPLDAQAWQRALADLLSPRAVNAEQADSEVLTMRAAVEREFAWSHLAERFEEHYQQIVQAGPGVQSARSAQNAGKP